MVLAAATNQCDQYPHNGYERATQENHQYCATNSLVLDAGIFFDALDRHKEVINAFATSILALFTVILAVATVFLWKSSEKHAIHMEASVDAAKSSVDIAKRAAENISVIERAYLLLDSGFIPSILTRNPIIEINGVIHQNPRPDYEFTIDFGFKNYGKTPAIITNLNIRIDYFREIPEKLAQFANILVNRFIVEPGKDAVHEWSTNGFVRHFEWQRASEGNGYVLFIGCVTYRDVFNDVRETYFCWYYDWESKNFMLYPSEDLNRTT